MSLCYGIYHLGQRREETLRFFVYLILLGEIVDVIWIVEYYEHWCRKADIHCFILTISFLNLIFKLGIVYIFIKHHT